MKIFTLEHRKNISLALTGKKRAPFSKTWRRNIGIAHRGLKRSRASCELYSRVKLGVRNPMWLGDGVGYEALHGWIKTRKPKPNTCEFCGKKKKLDLANKSQKYLRVIDDWNWLCRKCHMDQDGRLKRRDKNGRFTKTNMPQMW